MASSSIAGDLGYTGDFSKTGTSKGTLLVNDASIFDLLSVGANGTVLTANSATLTGLEWDTPSITTLTSAGGGANFGR